MDKRICVYEAGETDFASNGLGTIAPTDCTVHWAENGEYTVEIVHPVDDWGKYERLLKYDRTVVVPVPEAPSLRLNSIGTTTTAEVYTIQGSLRLRAGAGTNYKCLNIYRKGKKATLIAKTNPGWYEVIAPDGKHGWMSTKYLKYSGTKVVSSVSTELLRDLPMRPQPFDIYEIDPDVDCVTVKARHAFYRLAENLVCELEIKNKTAQQALDSVFGAALDNTHGFNWYCDTTSKASLEDAIEGKNIVDILIGDKGICQTYGLTLHVDWFDVFLVKDAGVDRGVCVRYAKNLTALTGGIDISDVVTRVVPVGQTKDGDPLYLSGTKWVESANAALYTRPKYGYLSVSDAKVGGKVDEDSDKKYTTDTARALMRERAQAELDGGCDLPTCSLGVEFVLLRDDPRYADYVDLEYICPCDTIKLMVPNFGINLSLRHTEYEFDALNQRYNEITIGSPQANMTNSGITSKQLGGASVTASKLAQNAVGSSALAGDVVGVRHIQAESINTEALMANSVTAEKIAADAITADKIETGALKAETIEAITAKIQEIVAGNLTTDTLYAALAEIIALKVGTITADSITTDQLAAVLGEFVALHAQTAGIDFATIKDLVAGDAIIREGTAGDLYIDRLSVTSATMLSATLGELVIKGEDGKYYQVSVTQDGTIKTKDVTVTVGEINAAETSDGRKIVETEIDVDALNASTIKASKAIIGEILVDALTAGKITATQAFISSAVIPSLYATSIKAIGDTIDISANKTIRLVVDGLDGVQAVVRVEDDGLYVGKSDSAAQVRITDRSVDVMDGVNVVSSFAGDRVTIKGYEIRNTSDGGIAFNP